MSLVFLVRSESMLCPEPPPFASAAAAGDHVQHHRALSLLPHLHQPVRHLPGPAQVEVQPLLPGQRWYEPSQVITPPPLFFKLLSHVC